MKTNQVRSPAAGAGKIRAVLLAVGAVLTVAGAAAGDVARRAKLLPGPEAEPASAVETSVARFWLEVGAEVAPFVFLLGAATTVAAVLLYRSTQGKADR